MSSSQIRIYNNNNSPQQKINKNKLSTFNQTFQSSILNKSSQKYTINKTLIKAIKNNNPSQIIQNGQQNDITQSNELYNQQKQINNTIINTRKKYDQLKTNSKLIQQRIQKLKKQKQYLQSQTNQIQQSFKSQQNQFYKVKLQLQQLQNLCQTAQYTKQVRSQISQILKQDILFYKKNCFQSNIKILRNHNQINSLSTQLQHNHKLSTNCQSLIYSIDKTIINKQSQRYDKINSYHQILNKKISNIQRKQSRQQSIHNSMLQAIYGKMPQQQQQKKVLLVHLSIKKILKLKMERQMQKYKHIQTAFRNVQQNTSVKRADQFIQRFLRRQQTYGALLTSISRNEQKINRLKQQKQILERQNNEILYQKQCIQDIQLQNKQQNNKEINMRIDLLRQKLIRNETLKNKIYIFVNKLIINFDNNNNKNEINNNNKNEINNNNKNEINNNNKNEINNKEISKQLNKRQQLNKKYQLDKNNKQQLNKNKPNILLRNILQKINKFIDNVNNKYINNSNNNNNKQKQKQLQQQLNQIYIQSKNLSLPNQIKTKNLRIKTLTHRQQTLINTIEDHDIAYNDLSQRDYLNYNRKLIKKSHYLKNRIKTKHI